MNRFKLNLTTTEMTRNVLNKLFKEIIQSNRVPFVGSAINAQSNYETAIFDPNDGSIKAYSDLTLCVAQHMRLAENPIDGWIECANDSAYWISIGMHENEADPIMGHMFWVGFQKQTAEFGKFAKSISEATNK